jgi:hypothetical protein
MKDCLKQFMLENSLNEQQMRSIVERVEWLVRYHHIINLLEKLNPMDYVHFINDENGNVIDISSPVTYEQLVSTDYFSKYYQVIKALSIVRNFL